MINKINPLLVNRITRILKLDELQSVILFYKVIIIESLQNGPTCGFFSLQCAANCLQLSTSPPIEDLLTFAKESGFTNIGELFSANWMVKIAEYFWAGDADFQSVPFPNTLETANRLRGNNSLLLVPYDCDKNFEPCNRGGQAAHWAIVTGFVTTTNASTSGIKWIHPLDELSITDETDFCVIAYHGKSRHPAVWAYQSLRESNSQLNNSDEKRAEQFRLPENGIAGIRGKCVWITKRN